MAGVHPRGGRSLILAVTAAVAAACSAGVIPVPSDTSPSPPATAAVTATVVYRLDSNASSVRVTFGPKASPQRVVVHPPWTATATAPGGTALVLHGFQLDPGLGVRLQCTLTVAVPGEPPQVTLDSSHIVGTTGSGAGRRAIYDGGCDAETTVP